MRARILRAIRAYFESNDFLEIEAPLMTPFPTLDANILSMESQFFDDDGRKQRFFLHTSPEHAMKKLLSAGAERIFYLGKVFRNGELSSLHNPEFTMLEWYRTQANYEDIQRDVERLIHHVVQKIFSKDTRLPLKYF